MEHPEQPPTIHIDDLKLPGPKAVLQEAVSRAKEAYPNMYPDSLMILGLAMLVSDMLEKQEYKQKWAGTVYCHECGTDHDVFHGEPWPTCVEHLKPSNKLGDTPSPPNQKD